MFVETIKSKQKNKTYTSVLIRENYRQEGKVKHRTLANISKLPAKLIASIKRLIKEDVHCFNSGDPLSVNSGREYGASFAVWTVARSLGLDKLIFSRPVQWREDVMAMIIGRIVYQGSKLKLTNLFADTALWEIAGHPAGQRVDVDKHCYEAMDSLLQRQDVIQKSLAKRHLDNGCLILYDITSVYMEGEYEESDLVRFGRSRDCKRGHEQIAIGLLADKNGCPVATEVFSGNTSDQTTVKKQAELLAEKYKVKDIVFAGDRGMLTPKRIEEVSALGFKTLTALTHPAIMNLLERKVIQLNLFDEHNIAEVIDPDTSTLRYMLCRNPKTQHEETQTRNALIEKTEALLKKLVSSKKRRTEQELAAAVGKALVRYKVAKFFTWEIKEGKLSWNRDTEKVEHEQSIDGCYIIRTDVTAKQMDKDEAVRCYRQLMTVEKAFRNIKTVSLEIRPIHHHLDDRIRAHVFLCMLAYYVQWNMCERLAPLFKEDGKGKERRWSFRIIIERLKSIRKQKAKIAGISIGDTVSIPDAEQNRILELLKVKM